MKCVENSVDKPIAVLRSDTETFCKGIGILTGVTSHSRQEYAGLEICARRTFL